MDQWLEYLNYEEWWSETLTAVAESLKEKQYHQPWKRLLEARRCPSREVMTSNGASATSSSAASGSTQTRQRRPGARNGDLIKELEAARADVDATNKMIDDLIRETASYRHAETAAYYQRLRVKWAVEEAHLMETEMFQNRRTAKSNTKVETKENKKRRRDDDEMTPEPRSKRFRRREGGQNTVSDTTSGKPQALRSSKRLANLKDKVPPNRSMSSST